MKQETVFVTRDRVRFPSKEKASEHCLEQAHTIIRELIRGAGPKYAAFNEAHKLAYEIVDKLAEDSLPVESLLGWLEDAKVVEEGK